MTTLKTFFVKRDKETFTINQLKGKNGKQDIMYEVSFINSLTGSKLSSMIASSDDFWLWMKSMNISINQF